MAGLFKNAQSFNKRLDRFLPPKIKMMQAKLEGIAYFIQHGLLSRTPVWSGSTVANYQWTISAPFMGRISPVETPAEGWGYTNQAGRGPLGPEKRRRANEEISSQSLRRINFKAAFGRVIYLVNNDPNFGNLERGVAPYAPPDLLPRSPGGMFGVTMIELKSRLESGTLRVFT